MSDGSSAWLVPIERLAEYLHEVDVVVRRSGSLLNGSHSDHKAGEIHKDQLEAYGLLQRTSHFLYGVLGECSMKFSLREHEMDVRERLLDKAKESMQRFFTSQAVVLSTELEHFSGVLESEQEKSAHRLQLLYSQRQSRRIKDLKRVCFTRWKQKFLAHVQKKARNKHDGHPRDHISSSEFLSEGTKVNHFPAVSCAPSNPVSRHHHMSFEKWQRTNLRRKVQMQRILGVVSQELFLERRQRKVEAKMWKAWSAQCLLQCESFLRTVETATTRKAKLVGSKMVRPQCTTDPHRQLRHFFSLWLAQTVRGVRRSTKHYLKVAADDIAAANSRTHDLRAQLIEAEASFRSQSVQWSCRYNEQSKTHALRQLITEEECSRHRLTAQYFEWRGTLCASQVCSLQKCLQEISGQQQTLKHICGQWSVHYAQQSIQQTSVLRSHQVAVSATLERNASRQVLRMCYDRLRHYSIAASAKRAAVSISTISYTALTEKREKQAQFTSFLASQRSALFRAVHSEMVQLQQQLYRRALSEQRASRLLSQVHLAQKRLGGREIWFLRWRLWAQQKSAARATFRDSVRWHLVGCQQKASALKEEKVTLLLSELQRRFTALSSQSRVWSLRCSEQEAECERVQLSLLRVAEGSASARQRRELTLHSSLQTAKEKLRSKNAEFSVCSALLVSRLQSYNAAVVGMISLFSYYSQQGHSAFTTAVLQLPMCRWVSSRRVQHSHSSTVHRPRFSAALTWVSQRSLERFKEYAAVVACSPHVPSEYSFQVGGMDGVVASLTKDKSLLIFMKLMQYVNLLTHAAMHMDVMKAREWNAQVTYYNAKQREEAVERHQRSLLRRTVSRRKPQAVMAEPSPPPALVSVGTSPPPQKKEEANRMALQQTDDARRTQAANVLLSRQLDYSRSTLSALRETLMRSMQFHVVQAEEKVRLQVEYAWLHEVCALARSQFVQQRQCIEEVHSHQLSNAVHSLEELKVSAEKSRAQYVEQCARQCSARLEQQSSAVLRRRLSNVEKEATACQESLYHRLSTIQFENDHLHGALRLHSRLALWMQEVYLHESWIAKRKLSWFTASACQGERLSIALSSAARETLLVRYQSHLLAMGSLRATTLQSTAVALAEASSHPDGEAKEDSQLASALFGTCGRFLRFSSHLSAEHAESMNRLRLIESWSHQLSALQSELI